MPTTASEPADPGPTPLGPRIVRRVRRTGIGLIARVPRMLELGGHPVRSWRVARDPNMRRAYRGNADRTVGLLVGDAAALAVACVVHPLAFVAMVAALAGAAGRRRWRERPGWGRRRGLPPGSVGLDGAALVRPDAFVEAWARYGPVFKSHHMRRPMVCIADLELATDLFRTHADDFVPTRLPYDRFVPGGMVRWAAEPRHTELRRLLIKALSPRFAEAWRPRMTELAAAQLHELAVTAGGAGFDPHGPMHDLVLRTWCEVMLGIGADDPAQVEVQRLIEDLAVYRHPPLPDHEVERRLDRIAVLVRRANRPGSEEAGRGGAGGPERTAGRPESLAATVERLHPGALDELGLIRNLVFLTVTSRDDISGLFVWLLTMLGREPRWLDAVHDDLTTGSHGGDLLERVLAETLRLEQSEYLFRTTGREIRFRGIVIPEGWMVRVLVHELHRDPRAFTDPDRFDPDRFVGGGPGPTVYAPFGVDHHSCIGERLTEAMHGALVSALALGFTARVVADGPNELSELRHWSPSSDLRIVLRPRDGRAADARSAQDALV